MKCWLTNRCTRVVEPGHLTDRFSPPAVCRGIDLLVDQLTAVFAKAACQISIVGKLCRLCAVRFGAAGQMTESRPAVDDPHRSFAEVP